MNHILNRREQKIFVICLIVLFIAVFYNGLVIPLERKKDSLDQEIAIEKKQFNRSVKVIRNAQKFNVHYDRYWKYFGKSGSGEEAISSILSEIEKVAGQLKLHVAELKPRRIKHNEFDDRFSVSLTITSEFIDVIRFLHTLEQSPYLFDVEEVEFEKSTRKNKTTITTYLVLGKTFILTSLHERIENETL